MERIEWLGEFVLEGSNSCRVSIWKVLQEIVWHNIGLRYAYFGSKMDFNINIVFAHALVGEIIN
jgi:hypothetical protein